MDKVLTITGELIPKENCIKIKNEYYCKNKDVVQLYNNPTGRWVRITHSWIGKDSHGIWIDKRNEGTGQVVGIIDVDNDGEFIFGEFIKSNYTTAILVIKNKKLYCLDDETAKKADFVISLNDNLYYHKSDSSKLKRFDPVENDFQGHSQIEHSLYSVCDNTTLFELNTRKYSVYPIIITDPMIKLSKIFPNYTFGLESEVGNLLLQIEMIGGTCLRDGSIKLDVTGQNGNEIASCILSGAKGFQSIYNFYSLNCARGYLNKTMGFHTHISHPKMLDNYGRCRPAFIVALYKLFYYLQEELELCIPKHRRNNPYCKLLPKLDFTVKNEEDLLKLFDKIWMYFSILKSSTKTISAFSDDPRSWKNQTLSKNKILTPWNRKWESSNRYSNLNLANMFWSLSRTIEIRHWSATLNPHKIMSELLIGLCIANYALTKEDFIIAATDDELKHLNLYSIIEDFVPFNNEKDIKYIKKLKNYLKGFVDQRIKELKHDITKEITGPKGQRLSYAEYELDSLWTPKTEPKIFDE